MSPKKPDWISHYVVIQGDPFISGLKMWGPFHTRPLADRFIRKLEKSIVDTFTVEAVESAMGWLL